MHLQLQLESRAYTLSSKPHEAYAKFRWSLTLCDQPCSSKSFDQQNQHESWLAQKRLLSMSIHYSHKPGMHENLEPCLKLKRVH